MGLPKLIFVEGLPNSGKTTLLKNIHKYLSENNVNTKVLCETDNSNPIEYYSNAFYSMEELHKSVQRYRLSYDDIKEYVVEFSGGYLIRKRKPLSAISHEFYKEAHTHNFFNLPLSLGFDVMDEIIKEFLSAIKNDEITYIIECAILQNPMRAIILEKNQRAIFEDRVTSICRLFSRYDLVICMNYHEDPADIVKNHTRRGEGWTHSCIHEFTENNYGRERGYVGIEGVALAYKELQEIQIEALKMSNCKYYLINNTKYEESDRENQTIDIFSELMS